MEGLRDRFLRVLAFSGAALVAITETLSQGNALSRGPVTVAGFGLLAAAVWIAVRRWTKPQTLRIDPLVALSLLGSGAILILTAVTAWFSPPNSADTMAYHLPRVIYWAEQHSIRFFPTPYLNQIMLQPLAEYAALHLYLLTGNDHLTNFVQWFASLGSAVAVSAIGLRFGARPRGQALAALFSLTIPAGVLASSGAKNDYVLALWLVVAVYFALRFTKRGETEDAVWLGASLGCALLTKATAYLFAPWLLLAVFAMERTLPVKRRALGGLLAVGCALLINTPHYIRNFDLSGSVMGFDSAHGDGVYRWRNDSFGWKQTLSNALRHASEQMGGRTDRWNQGVYQFVIDTHRKLGINPNDPATTWPFSEYQAPRKANHEVDAPNRWHILILLLTGCYLAYRAARGRNRMQAAYALAVVCAVVSLCFYLKWQPFMARLFLPMLVAAAPLVSVLELPAVGHLALSLFLLGEARLPVLENWTRPLRGPHNVFMIPRDQQYFTDLHPWDNEASYRTAVDAIAKTQCALVGIDINHYTLEYPLLALLRERKLGIAFVHTGVENASRKYPQPVPGEACAVACLDCLGDERKTALYHRFPKVIQAGKFVLFLNH